MSSVTTIKVPTQDKYRSTITSYASRGFQTLRDEGTSITLSKKKTFNWALAIILLFIPVIGWMALVAMLMASGRGSEVVEIVLDAKAA